MPGNNTNTRVRKNYFGENLDDDSKRSGTAARDSSGHVVPGEFNNATGKPMGTQPGNRPMGRTADAEWAKMFPGSPTAQRMQTGPAAPSPGGGPLWAQRSPDAARKQLQLETDVRLGRPLGATGGSSKGYSADEVGKMVAANPAGPMTLQTPWGPVARSGAPMPATPQAPQAIAQATPKPTPAITPATNVAAGPAISTPQPTAVTPASSTPGIMSRAGAAVAGGVRRATSAAVAPIAPLISGAGSVAQGVQAARPLWAPVANEAARQLTPAPVQAANAARAVWAAVPEKGRQFLRGSGRELAGAAVRNALPGPLGALWTLGQPRKKATPVNRPEAQPTY